MMRKIVALKCHLFPTLFLWLFIKTRRALLKLFVEFGLGWEPPPHPKQLINQWLKWPRCREAIDTKFLTTIKLHFSPSIFFVDRGNPPTPAPFSLPISPYNAFQSTILADLLRKILDLARSSWTQWPDINRMRKSLLKCLNGQLHLAAIIRWAKSCLPRWLGGGRRERVRGGGGTRSLVHFRIWRQLGRQFVNNFC